MISQKNKLGFDVSEDKSSSYSSTTRWSKKEKKNKAVSPCFMRRSSELKAASLHVFNSQNTPTVHLKATINNSFFVLFVISL